MTIDDFLTMIRDCGVLFTNKKPICVSKIKNDVTNNFFCQKDFRKFQGHSMFLTWETK